MKEYVGAIEQDVLMTSQVKETEGIERRKVLGGAICVLSSLILGAMSASAAAYLLKRPERQKPQDWTDAGDLPELQPGIPQQITFERSRTDGWKIHKEKDIAWVILNNDRTISAFSPLCTHLGCAYHWSAQRKQFSCPCHGSAFTASGAVISGPATRPLDRFETKLEGPRLWLGPAKATKVLS